MSLVPPNNNRFSDVSRSILKKEQDKPFWGNPEHPPEFMPEWLFLEMDQPAMTAFVGGMTVDPKTLLLSKADETAAALTRTHVEKVVGLCLQAAETAINQNPNLTFRLAGPEDVESISRLVHQLAIYEKEPDAVNVTANDYLLDGYAPSKDATPIFYCVLADVVNKDSVTTTCGMGLFYLAYAWNEGRFLYLEDLFVEEAFRGIGAGKAIMERLASISLALGCSKFVWTALDWNTPALNFYKRIGATVKSDLKLTRYCGKQLQLFANGNF